MAARGGFITHADLAAYRAIEREPVRGRYRGHDLVSAPPPVGGASRDRDPADPRPVRPVAAHGAALAATVHLTAEAMKRGFADYSAYIGDPDFADGAAGRAALDGLREGTGRRNPLGRDHAGEGRRAGEPRRRAASTTSLAVVDGAGQHGRADADHLRFLRRQGHRAGHRHHPQQRDEELLGARPERHGAGQADAHDDRADASCSRTGEPFATLGTPAPRASSRRWRC